MVMTPPVAETLQNNYKRQKSVLIFDITGVTAVEKSSTSSSSVFTIHPAYLTCNIV